MHTRLGDSVMLAFSDPAEYRTNPGWIYLGEYE
jgi:hypothetical protein